MMVLRPLRVRRLVALLALLVAGFTASGARAADLDPREVEARKRFASGQYQQALDLFAQLFAENGDAVFLRNVGRCYQKLEQPQPAIDRFREYLRRAKDMTPDERTEIEGYIKEMEDLKSRQQAGAAPSLPSPPSLPLLPVAPPPPDNAIVARPGEPPPVEARPVYKRPWFWAAVGAVVVSAVVIGVVATRSQRPDCREGFTCAR
jgi:hypothetical protein